MYFWITVDFKDFGEWKMKSCGRKQSLSQDKMNNKQTNGVKISVSSW